MEVEERAVAAARGHAGVGVGEARAEGRRWNFHDFFDLTEAYDEGFRLSLAQVAI